MILHYLKIAWRNIPKYKTQSIISIVGLAIGFTAFSFTMSWIRYETGYDSHNPNADQIYCVEELGSIYNSTSLGLTNYLRENFPEVEAACNVFSSQIILTEEQIKSEWEQYVNDYRFSVSTDTAFFSVFYPDIKVKYPNPLPEKATILTKSIADKWNINPQMIGEVIESLDFTPIAIVNDKSLHSNVAFNHMDVSIPTDEELEALQSLWDYHSGLTYFRLHKGASINKIVEALDNLQIPDEIEPRSYKIYPLRKAHYLLSNDDANIKLETLKQFSIVALLVIISALLNYIMLFLTRIKARKREFALNKVNGASTKKILLLLTFEFLIILLGAIFVGGLLTELLFPAFSRFSMIIAPKSYFITSVLWYSSIIIVVSTITLLVFVYRFVQKSIHENITHKTNSAHIFKINFSQFAIFVQLFIGILLIFCTSVVFNQYHLMDQRVGYNRNGLMVYGTNNDKFPISEIKKIPGIGDFIVNSESIFSWSNGRQRTTELDITNQEGKTEKHSLSIKFVDTNFRAFLEIPLLQGRDMLPSDEKVYFANEKAAMELGGDPVGYTVYGTPIIGVIPNLQIESPLVAIEPILYLLDSSDNIQMCNNITFRSENDSITKRVRDWFDKEFPPTDTGRGYSFYNYYHMNIDDNFKEFTKSERNLLALISLITVVAILIALFGIYSMVTLSCNQRRKEIAIRKVNGAKVKEIFALFFKEYFYITLFAAIVAFPIGSFIMQRWLEQYTRRVTLAWWLYAAVFILISFIVFASIFLRVRRAAKENPADVVKSE